jgi:hypothetical protein
VGLVDLVRVPVSCLGSSCRSGRENAPDGPLLEKTLQVEGVGGNDDGRSFVWSGGP